MSVNRNVIEELFSVERKIALVTGGTDGPARMIAEGLLTGGAKVYVVARNSEDCIHATEELSAEGDCKGIVGDLSTLDGISAIAQAIGRMEEMVHILVNGAGTLRSAPIDMFSEEAWDATMDLNLKAPFFLTQKLLPLLRKASTHEDPSRVILVGSSEGLRPKALDNYAYQCSKSGLHHLARVLAGRLASDDITVNALALGVFPSQGTAHHSSDVHVSIGRGVPRGRFGQAQDVAGAALYLCSRAGAYVTGSVLSVDGGWSSVG